MAVLCRCQEHHPRNNRKNVYTHIGEPIGYPNTSSICGIRQCKNAGLIYMDNNAVREYNRGARIFHFASRVTKVKVKDKAPRFVESM